MDPAKQNANLQHNRKEKPISSKYYKANEQSLVLQLRDDMSLLPDFCSDFFRGIAETTQIKTRIAYCLDIKVFLEYLVANCASFSEFESIKEIRARDLDLVSPTDIEKYIEHLSFYEVPNPNNPDAKIQHSNSPSGKMRKLSSLKSFYKYFYRKQEIKTNPAQLVDLPKLKERTIVRLEPNEVADLLDSVESGNELTERQRAFHAKNAKRDLAIISLFLGTGIRISELVGLNTDDFDFSNASFKITRKGGDQAILYLSDELLEIICDYLNSERENLIPLDAKDEKAMFLSLQKKRIGVSAVEKLVKKYTQNVVPLKNITPHKFRSTYGTNLYKETGDIYLVADVLGHKDINTTRKHYASMSEERRKQAAKATKLRDGS